VKEVLVDKISEGTPANYTFENVQANHEIHVTFEKTPEPEPESYLIVSTAGEGGKITPEGDTTVKAGGSQAYTFTPDAGYQVKDVLVDKISEGTPANYTFEKVQANHEIHVTFEKTPEPEPESYTIVSTAGEGGKITPDGNTTVKAGGSQAYAMQPETGYQVKDVLVDNVSVGKVVSYAFEDVKADHTISVTFEIIPIPDTDPRYYTIVSSAGKGGIISPRGNTTVNAGGSQAYTFAPNDGYMVYSVLVDGEAVEHVGNAYTFSNVRADHTIHVTFTDSSNPKTGDDSNPIGWIMLLGASLLGLITLVVMQLRKRRGYGRH
jgi:hypothetical protein